MRVRFKSLRKLPKEAAKRLELLRRSGRQTLEREMYEVYTDMLKRNEDLGMSEMDLQGPTSFHTKMDAIRPQVDRQSWESALLSLVLVAMVRSYRYIASCLTLTENIP